MSLSMLSDQMRAICQSAPVMPVLVSDDPARGQDFAQALVTGGLRVLELTLRTPRAFEVLHEMAQVEGAIVGAGTVLTPQDMARAKAAGARFAVSPGATPALLDAARDLEMPLLPGAATASEVMALLDLGITAAKFFPAEAIGGRAALQALGQPLPQMGFCPTGGISLVNAPQYLALTNVLCVGGSWVAPAPLIAAQDWEAITTLAREAAALRIL